MRTTGRILEPLGFAYPLEEPQPAAGFASRLAALNGRSLKDLLRDMSIPPRSLDKGIESAVRDIALLGRADPEKLLRYTPVPYGDRLFRVGDEFVIRLAVNRTYFRFCARCALEDMDHYDGPSASRPWLRLEWILSHFRSCPRHGVLLTATSPPRRPFAPFDFNDTMRGLIPNLARMADEAMASSPSPFQTWLRDRLGGVRADNNWLDDLPLYVAAPFCEALGVSSLHEPKVRTARFTVSDWAIAADEGFRIASAGEEALRALLARLNKAQSSTRGFWGPRDTYGYAYGLLQKTLDDPAYGKLRDVVRRFALETMPIEPGTNILGEIAGSRKVHTVRTAARDSGAHALTIRRLFQRMGVDEAEDQSGLMDHRVLVRSAEVHRVVAELKDAITAPEVEALLGVPRLHLKELVANGYLRALADTGSRRYAKRRFSRADIEELRERLFEGACEVSEPTNRQVDVTGARRASTCTIPDVLDMIFTGKLAWKGRLSGRKDYLALLLDADEVTRIVRSRETRSNLTKEETEAFLPGTYDRVVNKLIAAGHLTLVEEFSPDARRMIAVVSRESAEGFRSRFVSLGELCQKTGLHHKKVRLILRSAGIKAAFVPYDLGAFFYNREDVRNAEAQEPSLWHYNKVDAQKKAREQSTQRDTTTGHVS
ncbi:TniQ family protein [Pseudaminobacter sp. 19-2017]|uniref:TniQ family protein n=1 Tax=Pseudaminobacter soli (ex Zhang et al. 2022) TaxID=2831468 RepID=A0A942E1K3_9HYPH|nr:TniQ family protein [Pseudaminobacter soli]MBS3652079.1 TniQ family protein [Pseudaminobacter soli]